MIFSGMASYTTLATDEHEHIVCCGYDDVIDDDDQGTYYDGDGNEMEKKDAEAILREAFGTDENGKIMIPKSLTLEAMTQIRIAAIEADDRRTYEIDEWGNFRVYDLDENGEILIPDIPSRSELAEKRNQGITHEIDEKGYLYIYTIANDSVKAVVHRLETDGGRQIIFPMEYMKAMNSLISRTKYMQTDEAVNLFVGESKKMIGVAIDPDNTSENYCLHIWGTMEVYSMSYFLSDPTASWCKKEFTLVNNVCIINICKKTLSYEWREIITLHDKGLFNLQPCKNGCGY